MSRNLFRLVAAYAKINGASYVSNGEQPEVVGKMYKEKYCTTKSFVQRNPETAEEHCVRYAVEKLSHA